MRWTARAGLMATCLAAADALAVPPAEASPQEAHAAQCAAALDASADALARQARAGKKELRRPVQETLQGGIAFFAAAYVEGGAAARRAQHLAAQARAPQAKMTPAELAALQAGCLDEGRKLFTGADGLTRAVVSRQADLRLERLLGK